MKTVSILFVAALCVTISVGVTDQCMERYKICSVKDRFTLQRICRKSGGMLRHALKYAGKEIISDCCRPGGCTKQYLCDFCENSCCQIAIDVMVMD